MIETSLCFFRDHLRKNKDSMLTGLGLHTAVFQAEIYAIRVCVMKNTQYLQFLHLNSMYIRSNSYLREEKIFTAPLFTTINI